MRLWQKFLDEMKFDLLFEFIKTGGKQLLDAMSPGDRKFLRFRLTGQTPIDDEQIFEKAIVKLLKESGGHNINILMHERLERLAVISPKLADYYRLIITGQAHPEAKSKKADDDRRATEAMETLIAHAKFDQKTWDNHVAVMELNKAKVDTLAEKIQHGGAELKQQIVALSDSIEAATGMEKNAKTVSGWLDNTIKDIWK